MAKPSLITVGVIELARQRLIEGLQHPDPKVHIPVALKVFDKTDANLKAESTGVDRLLVEAKVEEIVSLKGRLEALERIAQGGNVVIQGHELLTEQ